jgi:L-seryl-tRNA(Ser) seleniumtransferase
VLVTLAPLSAGELEQRLRAQPVPVIARIEHDRVVLDLRTVDPADDSLIAQAIISR